MARGWLRGAGSPQRTLTNCHLQRNTRFVRTIIRRDAAVAGVARNPYIERKIPGPPPTKLDVVANESLLRWHASACRIRAAFQSCMPRWCERGGGGWIRVVVYCEFSSPSPVAVDTWHRLDTVCFAEVWWNM